MTGFDASNNWKQTKFKADGKYIVRPPNKSDDDFLIQVNIDTKFVVVEFGSDYIMAVCDTSEFYKKKKDLRQFNFHCRGWNRFVINTATLRYYNVTQGSYLENNKEGDDIGIEIGRCSKI